MVTVPSQRDQPGPWTQLGAMFGLFAGGGLIGLALTSWAAPDSGLAAAISVPLLPTTFAAGLLIWGGLDVVAEAIAILRRRTQPDASRSAKRTHRWFVTVSTSVAAAAGLIVGLVPGGANPAASALVYMVVGGGYGATASRLAARGYLPPARLG